MFQHHHQLSRLAVLALAIAAPLAACGAPSSTPLAMTQAVKKPNGSGIDVQFAVDGTPQVGRGVAVILRFDNVTDPVAAKVHFTADAGVTLTGADGQRLPAGEMTTLTVQATPSSEGLAYVNVFTTQNDVTSATSIPIQVGKPAQTMRSNGVLKRTPAGEAVISLPTR